MVNLHPIFVHFPIALLTLYALAEVLLVGVKKKKKEILLVKEVLLYLGILGSWAAYVSGDAIEDLGWSEQLVDLHESYATLTIILFAILTAAYLIPHVTKLLERFVKQKGVLQAWSYVGKLADLILHPAVRVAMAVAALLAITITGALGGALAHGPDVDPVVNFIYNLLLP